MTAATTDYAVDRLDDDGSPIRPTAHGEGQLGRLVLAPTVEGRRLDGAWWPRTGDAVAELNALVPPVSEHLHTLDAGTVTLGRGTHDRVTLVVIPSDLEPATGRNLLRRLSTVPRWPDTAAAVIAESWPGEGGRGA